VKRQADDLQVGDVILTRAGVLITVRELERSEAGCLVTNPGAPDQLDGHAWEWVEIVSRNGVATA
jgi:hypothetical protein